MLRHATSSTNWLNSKSCSSNNALELLQASVKADLEAALADAQQQEGRSQRLQQDMQRLQTELQKLQVSSARKTVSSMTSLQLHK